MSVLPTAAAEYEQTWSITLQSVEVRHAVQGENPQAVVDALQKPVRCVSKDPTPGNVPRLHVAPEAHDVLACDVEQQVSMQAPPAHRPERHWPLPVQVVPPANVPSVDDRESHAGLTQ